MYYVLGSGSIGQRHHENLKALGADVRLLGWRGLDLDDLADDLAGAAGIVIATATQVRLELILLAARLEVPVYVEKPLAFRMDEVQSIFEIAEPIADRSVLGYMMRYHPAVLALLADPVDAYRADFEIGHDVRQWRANWQFGDSYAARSEGGGVLLDLCHELDLAHVLLPGLELGAVECLGHADFPGVDFATRIALGNGAVSASVSMDYLSPRSIRGLRLRGREGGVDLDLLNAREVYWRGSDETPRDWVFERNDMFLALMGDFMALAEGRAPSDNPILPRLDRVYDSASLIARAWEARRFQGQITGGFA